MPVSFSFGCNAGARNWALSLWMMKAGSARPNDLRGLRLPL